MSDSRLNVIARIADPAQRGAALRALHADLTGGKATPLSAAEAFDTLRMLARDDDGYCQALLWSLVLGAGKVDKGREFALQWLGDTARPHRGTALEYLRSCYPEAMPALIRSLLDPASATGNPEILYQLALYLLPTEPDRALDLMIDALATDSHETFDAITMDLAENGKTVHLERLRRLDAEAGGDTGYGRVADTLQASLEGDLE